MRKSNQFDTSYKMSGRWLCTLITLIKDGHEFCKLILKRTQIVVQ